MLPLITTKLPELHDLCVLHQVRTLELFGSASKGEFQETSSDLDFLVEFLPLEPVTHSRCYFGLLSGLGELFQLPIDLVEAPALDNPYLLAAIKPERRLLYGH